MLDAGCDVVRDRLCGWRLPCLCSRAAESGHRVDAAAPQWLAGVIDSSWQRVYGQRVDRWRLPEAATARQDLAVRCGQDGYWLLEQVYGRQAPGWLLEPPAVQVLRRIWIQQYYRDGRR